LAAARLFAFHLALEASRLEESCGILVRGSGVRFGGVELPDRFGDGVGIEDHDRCATITAGGRALQVNRCAATRAANDPDQFFQAFEFVRRHRPDEILFAQELQKRRESAMPMAAAIIGETRRPLQIVRQGERGIATRAGNPRG